MFDSQDATPSALTPTNSKASIVLQVGEQYFHSTRSVLNGSTFLYSLLERWDADKQADGSYFLDQDPELFKYVLRFLRHGVFPLCYDRVRGHDFATYGGVQILAKYLGVNDLAVWLDEKRYLNAVNTTTSGAVEEGEGPLMKNLSSDVDVEYHPTWRAKQVYVCPRGLHSEPSGRGKQCRRVQGNAVEQYEGVEVLSTLVVTKRSFFVGSVGMSSAG